MILVPIKTGRGMNSREHWRARARRVKAERHAVAWMLKGQPKPPIPCAVRLTRVAPGNPIDTDNLAGACKSCRDQIAEWLGIDDGRAEVCYVYAQRRGPWAVEIEWGEHSAAAEFKPLAEAA